VVTPDDRRSALCARMRARKSAVLPSNDPTLDRTGDERRGLAAAMPDLTKTYDVLVAGGGNAALCAAITRARLVPRAALNMRLGPFVVATAATPQPARDAERPTDVLTEAYGEDEYWDD